jgi:hypothetical protein
MKCMKQVSETNICNSSGYRLSPLTEKIWSKLILTCWLLLKILFQKEFLPLFPPSLPHSLSSFLSRTRLPRLLLNSWTQAILLPQPPQWPQAKGVYSVLMLLLYWKQAMLSFLTKTVWTDGTSSLVMLFLEWWFLLVNALGEESLPPEQLWLCLSAHRWPTGGPAIMPTRGRMLSNGLEQRLTCL